MILVNFFYFFFQISGFFAVQALSSSAISISLSFVISSAKSAIYMTLLSVVILVLATKGIRDEGTVSLQGDMPRYLMNGVYFYDLIKDFPLTHPMKYTYQYFARYPALSLGHHPLLLSIAEVPFYAVFGISVFSGRLTILCQV